MRKYLRYILVGCLVVLASCYDDLGNYDYKDVEDPKVLGLQDSTFVAYIGDSLIVEPVITHSLQGTEDLSYEWKISNHIDMRSEYFKGPGLRMFFNLKPAVYSAMLTITNHVNDMKYFYTFKVEGRTEFTRGLTVLSNDGGMSKLSFVRDGRAILPDLYEALHGEPLPNNPRQLLIVDHNWLKAYHVLTGEEGKPGVIVDATTMLRVKNMEDNFFQKPAHLSAQSIQLVPSGVSTGIISGRLYSGFWQTCPCSPIFGVYGAPAAGDYTLSPYFNYYPSHYLGYDIAKKRFVQFDLNLNYNPNYSINATGPGFDPKNVGVDLIYMADIAQDKKYAFGRDATDTLFEFKFWDVPNMFFPLHKRPFVGASYVRADTKWAASTRNIIYFSSGDKVYRYNPDNEDIQLLTANLGGKTVTMLKLIDNDLLLAGVDGTLYYLDVRVGKGGEIYQTIEGIPGYPVDAVLRK